MPHRTLLARRKRNLQDADLSGRIASYHSGKAKRAGASEVADAVHMPKAAKAVARRDSLLGAAKAQEDSIQVEARKPKPAPRVARVQADATDTSTAKQRARASTSAPDLRRAREAQIADMAIRGTTAEGLRPKRPMDDAARDRLASSRTRRDSTYRAHLAHRDSLVARAKRTDPKVDAGPHEDTAGMGKAPSRAAFARHELAMRASDRNRARDKGGNIDLSARAVSTKRRLTRKGAN